MTGRTEGKTLTVDRWIRRGGNALQLLEEKVALLEPRIHALVAEPERFDRLRRQVVACPVGPLKGVPIGVKDIFHVEGLETRAGSRLPAAELAGAEATSVTLLRRSGALILGKTVSTEFAYFAPGPTRNPHHTGHTPGGSSSGSAAAVAAGYCPLALGTQTIGSICRPASFCGVVGFKPSHDRISTAGVIPLAPSLDHVGVFASNIADVALVASILCRDWQPAREAARPVLAIPRGPYLDRASLAGLAHFERVCALIRSRGWEIVSVETMSDFAAIEERNGLILAAEVARVHQDWYSRFGELYHPTTRDLIEKGMEVSDTALAAALEERRHFAKGLHEKMRQRRIDIWISPAATGAAPQGLDSTGDPVMSLPWTQAGFPALSLPAGFDDHGLPLGLQMIARPEADEHLLRWAQELEGALETAP